MKKKMEKRWIALVLAVVLTVSTMACGAPETGGTGSSSSSAGSTVSSNTDSAPGTGDNTLHQADGRSDAADAADSSAESTASALEEVTDSEAAGAEDGNSADIAGSAENVSAGEKKSEEERTADWEKRLGKSFDYVIASQEEADALHLEDASASLLIIAADAELSGITAGETASVGEEGLDLYNAKITRLTIINTKEVKLTGVEAESLVIEAEEGKTVRVRTDAETKIPEIAVYGKGAVVFEGSGSFGMVRVRDGAVVRQEKSEQSGNSASGEDSGESSPRKLTVRATCSVVNETQSAVLLEEPDGTEGELQPAEQRELVLKGYEVSFIADGQTLETQYKEPGDVIAFPSSVPEKQGYLFTSWYRDADFTESVSQFETADGETTYYARYIPEDEAVTVTFDVQGGSSLSPVRMAAGETLLTRPAKEIYTTKEGYTFGGWCLDSDFTEAFSYSEPVNENLTLYAYFVSDDIREEESNGNSAELADFAWDGKIALTADAGMTPDQVKAAVKVYAGSGGTDPEIAVTEENGQYYLSGANYEQDGAFGFEPGSTFTLIALDGVHFADYAKNVTMLTVSVFKEEVETVTFADGMEYVLWDDVTSFTPAKDEDNDLAADAETNYDEAEAEEEAEYGIEENETGTDGSAAESSESGTGSGSESAEEKTENAASSVASSVSAGAETAKKAAGTAAESIKASAASANEPEIYEDETGEAVSETEESAYTPGEIVIRNKTNYKEGDLIVFYDGEIGRDEQTIETWNGGSMDGYVLYAKVKSAEQIDEGTKITYEYANPSEFLSDFDVHVTEGADLEEELSESDVNVLSARLSRQVEENEELKAQLLVAAMSAKESQEVLDAEYGEGAYSLAAMNATLKMNKPSVKLSVSGSEVTATISVSATAEIKKDRKVILTIEPELTFSQGLEVKVSVDGGKFWIDMATSFLSTTRIELTITASTGKNTSVFSKAEETLEELVKPEGIEGDYADYDSSVRELMDTMSAIAQTSLKYNDIFDISLINLKYSFYGIITFGVEVHFVGQIGVLATFGVAIEAKSGERIGFNYNFLKFKGGSYTEKLESSVTTNIYLIGKVGVRVGPRLILSVTICGIVKTSIIGSLYLYAELTGLYFLTANVLTGAKTSLGAVYFEIGIDVVISLSLQVNLVVKTIRKTWNVYKGRWPLWSKAVSADLAYMDEDAIDAQWAEETQNADNRTVFGFPTLPMKVWNLTNGNLLNMELLPGVTVGKGGKVTLSIENLVVNGESVSANDPKNALFYIGNGENGASPFCIYMDEDVAADELCERAELDLVITYENNATSALVKRQVKRLHLSKKCSLATTTQHVKVALYDWCASAWNLPAASWDNAVVYETDFTSSHMLSRGYAPTATGELALGDVLDAAQGSYPEIASMETSWNNPSESSGMQYSTPRVSDFCYMTTANGVVRYDVRPKTDEYTVTYYLYVRRFEGTGSWIRYHVRLRGADAADTYAFTTKARSGGADLSFTRSGNEYLLTVERSQFDTSAQALRMSVNGGTPFATGFTITGQEPQEDVYFDITANGRARLGIGTGEGVSGFLFADPSIITANGVRPGTQVELRVNLADGYGGLMASCGNASVNFTVSGDTVSFTMPSTDIYVTLRASRLRGITYMYNYGGHGAWKTEYFTENENTAAPEDPKIDGLTFRGWYTTPACDGTPYAFGEKLTEDVTLYADWTCEVTVHFAPAKGQAVYITDTGEEKAFFADAAQTYSVFTFSTLRPGEVLPEIRIPDYEGYQFAGWYLNPDFSGNPIDETSFRASGGLNLYARWARELTVTFDRNDGSADSTYESVPASAGSHLPYVPDAPERENYSFTGWFTDQAGTEPFDAANEVINWDMTVYAGWKANAFSISYELDGGTNAPENPSGYTTGGTVTLAAPEKEGYAFAGWTGTGLLDVTAEVTIGARDAGDRTYTAHWTPEVYPIIYSGQAAETAGNPAEYTIESEDILLNNPERTHYTFRGWTGTGLSSPSLAVRIPKGSTGRRSYRANWTAVSYTITYELGGGSANGNPETYTVESGEITLQTPVRDGYTFTGWTGSNGAAPETEVTIPAGASGNRTYTANWTADAYTITYNLGGGTADGNPESYTVDSDAITLQNPTRRGYTFTGWTGSNGTVPEKAVTIEKGSKGAKTYTANWEANVYSISYDLDGGSVDGNPVSCTVESGDITLHAPVKKGYTFTGWTGSNGAEPQTLVTIPAGSIGNRIYTANWNLDTYKIEYRLNGGSVSGNPESYTVLAEDFTLVNPVRTGYTFTGWTGSNGTAPETDVTVAKGSAGDKTYTANWSVNVYTISYDLGGGSADGNPAGYSVESDEITLNAPVKNGYIFVGWTGTNGAVPETSVTIPAGSTGNRTYTADWKAVTYSITYDLDGGHVSSAHPADYTVETETFALAAPEKSGFVFTGWTGSNGTSPETEVVIEKGSTGDRHYKANWAEDIYTIKFAGGDAAEGTMADQTAARGTAVALNANAFVRAGCKFAGWAAEEGGAAVYADGAAVTDLAARGAAVTLYAVWEAETYRISYSGPAAEVTGNPDSYTVESADIVLQNPARRGYTFIGWTGSNGAEPEMSVTLPAGSVGDKLYTANWQINTYSITCELNGGSADGNPETYTVESDAISLNAPAKTGYTFTGWTGSNGAEPETSVAIPAGSIGDRIYTANWEIISYSISYDLDGGTVRGGNPVSFTAETETFTLTNPTKQGYIFTGWTGTDGTSPETEIVIPKGSTGDRSYKANWAEHVYTVQFMHGAADAEGTMADQTVAGGTAVKLNPNAFTRKGYTFAGWAAEEGGAAKYEDGAAVTDLAARGETATLYAVWNLETYQITYSGTGAETVDNPTSYTVETEAFTLKNPERVGYTFLGWTGANGAEPETAVTVAKGETGDKSFTANWEADAWVIRTNLNGGNADTNPSTYTLESGDITLTAPTRDGYAFTGWTGSNGDTPEMTVTIHVNDMEDKEYTAHWQIDTYSISYDLDGGSVASENPASFTAETDDFTLVNPTREGYVFTGWTGSNGTSPETEVVIAKGSSGARSYTANWAEDVYTISFRNGSALAQGSMEDQTAAVGKAVNLNANAFTRAGYNFAGWAEAEGGEAAHADGASVTDLAARGETVTLTAVWTPKQYELYMAMPGLYDDSGQQQQFIPISEIAAEYEEESGKLEYNSPRLNNISNYMMFAEYLPGYVLAGFYNYEGTEEDARAQGINPVKVYNADGSAVAGTPYFYYGTDENGTALESDVNGTGLLYHYDGDTYIYPHWEMETYTITYDLDGGTVSGNPTSYNVQNTIETGGIRLNQPTKYGYKFLGWSGSDLWGDPEPDVTIWPYDVSDRTYTAHWERASYGITYELGGGTGKDNPDSYETLAEDDIVLNAPVRDGCTFLGWTGSNGNAPQQSVTIEKGSEGDRTYKANWKLDTYNITCDLGGGTVTGNPDAYTVESADIELHAPEKNGYTFTGWTGTGISGKEKEVTIASGSTGDRSYTANWEAVQYTISYSRTYGSAAENPASYTIESGDIVLAAPEKSGYTFKGWTGTGITGTALSVTIPKGSTGARSYTAVWESTSSAENILERVIEIAEENPYTGDLADYLTADDFGTNGRDYTRIEQNLAKVVKKDLEARVAADENLSAYKDGIAITLASDWLDTDSDAEKQRYGYKLTVTYQDGGNTETADAEYIAVLKKVQPTMSVYKGSNLDYGERVKQSRLLGASAYCTVGSREFTVSGSFDWKEGEKNKVPFGRNNGTENGKYTAVFTPDASYADAFTSGECRVDVYTQTGLYVVGEAEDRNYRYDTDKNAADTSVTGTVKLVYANEDGTAGTEEFTEISDFLTGGSWTLANGDVGTRTATYAGFKLDDSRNLDTEKNLLVYALVNKSLTASMTISQETRFAGIEGDGVSTEQESYPYGTKLSEILLQSAMAAYGESGDTVSVDAESAWADDVDRNRVLNAGEHSINVKLTPDAKYHGGYAVGAATATVTIEGRTIQVPTVGNKTWNGQNQKSGLTDTAYYTVVSDAGGTNAGEQPAVVLSLRDKTNYTWVDSSGKSLGTGDQTIAWSINKADITLKTNNAGVTDLLYGQKLSGGTSSVTKTVQGSSVQTELAAKDMLRGYSAAVQGASGEQTVSGTWTWVLKNGKAVSRDGRELAQPLDVGTYYLKAQFTPAESINLNGLETYLQVKVTASTAVVKGTLSAASMYQPQNNPVNTLGANAAIDAKNMKVYNRYTGAQISGTWNWSDPDSMPNRRTSDSQTVSLSATFTPASAANRSRYTATGANCDVELRKYIYVTKADTYSSQQPGEHYYGTWKHTATEKIENPGSGVSVTYNGLWDNWRVQYAAAGWSKNGTQVRGSLTYRSYDAAGKGTDDTSGFMKMSFKDKGNKSYVTFTFNQKPTNDITISILLIREYDFKRLGSNARANSLWMDEEEDLAGSAEPGAESAAAESESADSAVESGSTSLSPEAESTGSGNAAMNPGAENTGGGNAAVNPGTESTGGGNAAVNPGAESTDSENTANPESGQSGAVTENTTASGSSDTSVASQSAAAPTPAPTPAPTAAPTPEPTPAPTPAPVPEAAASAEETALAGASLAAANAAVAPAGETEDIAGVKKEE